MRLRTTWPRACLSEELGACWLLSLTQVGWRQAGCDCGLHPSQVCDQASYSAVLGICFCTCNMGRRMVPPRRVVVRLQ